ncbi:MAG: hypothetical protein QOF85_1597 [Solirubrobacterales bacterium]|jgi:ribosomal protein S18 acetylase RimI-like enzyme|nr:hypothetical protein [Solirubrobacterales bacterium]
MSIRAANDGDAEAVIALWTEGYVTEGQGGRTLPYTESEFFETASVGTLFVAECRGEVGGVVALLAPGAEDSAVARDDEAELCRLTVAPSARRQGIGRALTNRCADVARAKGWPAIALWSRRYQTAAHRLYESLGYCRTPDRDSVDETGHERLVFRLER